MRIPRDIQRRIKKIVSPKRVKPCIAFVKKVTAPESEHFGEYQATIDFWDDVANSGYKYKSQFIYTKDDAEAFEALERMNVPVVFYDDLTEAI